MKMTEALQFRTGALSHRKPTRFRLLPDAALKAELASALGLQKIRHLLFEGEIAAAGRSDFVLAARLKAEVVQSCVVSLAAVPAMFDEPVTRRYAADLSPPDGDEIEISAEDGPDPLPELIDLVEVLREALALALPLYPRAPGAALGEAVFAAPGTTPIRDDDLKPFAGLAGLVKKTDPAGE